MNRISNKRKIAFVLLVIMTVAWMAVIYGFSDSDGDESKDHSRGISEKLALTLKPEYEIPEKYTEQDFFFYVVSFVRKSAHVFSYALLGVLTYLAAGSLKLLPYKIVTPAYISVPICVLYSISDEIHQSFVEGRCGTPKDVLVDGVGVVVGTALCAYIVNLIFKHKKRV